MYVLHIANRTYSSWSLRGWLLMRALAIPFEERLLPFVEDSNRERFRRFSPTATVPCLVDGDITVWDSLAIAEYLAERHEGTWPADRAARAWARSAAAEMHAGFGALRNALIMCLGIRVRPNPLSAEVRQQLDRIGELWREGLDRWGGPFLAGPSFGAVDAFYAPVTTRLETYGVALDPATDAYAARVRALPAMAEWSTAALNETWREPAHEADIRANGTILEDRRAV